MLNENPNAGLSELKSNLPKGLAKRLHKSPLAGDVTFMFVEMSSGNSPAGSLTSRMMMPYKSLIG